jgi:hypothetical protein
MASTYTPNLGFEKPAFGDSNWNVALDDMRAELDALAPVGGLGVRPSEIPSASLNVSVAPGDYLNSDGSKGTYAGVATQAIPSLSTTVLFLDLTALSVLTLAASYPTATAHVPIATVVAGATTISSIADDRVPGGTVLRTLVNAASDGAAATAGCPIGGLYRNGNVVQVRIV